MHPIKKVGYSKSGPFVKYCAPKRSRILDEVCETLGYTHKYVIKLMSGNIRYRERKGRGRTYGTSALENARRIWESIGCPCTTYFVVEMPRIVREYGDTQIDTVAHCGGDMRGNFFWTLTQTDRNTQWTEITTTWNRGMHNTVSALKRLERRFPFPITAEHEDNGPEFINYAMAEMQTRGRHTRGFSILAFSARKRPRR